MTSKNSQASTPLQNQELLFEERKNVGWAKFNRPKARNALTLAMYDRLAEICRSCDGKGAVKALIVTGCDEHAFAAGTDISLFRNFETKADGLDYEARMEKVLTDIENCAVPTIAAISGPCTGGGAAIATVCDIRLATSSMRFGFPIARTLGNCLSATNLIRLTEALGSSRTRDIMMTARLIGPEEAQAMGLVREVLSNHEALLARADTLAEQLISHAPLTLSATKVMLRRIREARPNIEDEDLIARCYTSNDFKEGIDAFLTKRPPEWKGH